MDTPTYLRGGLGWSAHGFWRAALRVFALPQNLERTEPAHVGGNKRILPSEVVLRLVELGTGRLH